MTDTSMQSGSGGHSPEAALDYCRKRVLAPGSRLSMTLGFVPVTERTARIAFYALLADLADIAERVSEPTVAVAKLGWWQEELQRAGAGQPRHPTTRLLVRENVFQRLDAARLNALLLGVEKSHDLPALKDAADLHNHCRQLGGMAAELELDLAAVTASDQHLAARSVGSGQYLTRLLLDLARDTAAGRWWLPRELQAEFAVDRDAILNNAVAGQALVAELASLARDWLRPETALQDTHLRIQQALELRLASRCLRKPGDCLAGQIGRQPLRETWLAWRSARGRDPGVALD